MLINKFWCLCLIVFVLVLTLGCVSYVRVRGKVLESDGSKSFCGIVYQSTQDPVFLKPLNDVKVTLIGQDGCEEAQITHTDNEGKFEFTIKTNYFWNYLVEVTCEKKGYNSITQKVFISRNFHRELKDKELIKCYLTQQKAGIKPR